jgi:citrate synthase
MLTTGDKPGLEGVIAGETAISTLAAGLHIRGYAIEDLAAHGTYEETAFLLLHGALPAAAQLSAFRQHLAECAAIPGAVLNVLRVMPANTPMMDVMRSGASLLAHWDPDASDHSRAANLRKAERLVAQLPIVMAARQRLLNGLEPIDPDARLSRAAQILWTLTGRPPSAREERALDVSLILYAEHEFNASTFTARVVCSTLSDLHSAVTAAIAALKGPLHGGANAHVIDVLREAGSPARAEQWVRDAVATRRRIMGFGHRIYKTGDPRAILLKSHCADLARDTGHETWEKIAEVIEQAIFKEKGLLPNVDWPMARLFFYLGLPVDLYTPLFVVSRIAGWCAHVLEQIENNRLIHPQANYVGPAPRAWAPVAQRRK